jgi:hypothetical protein
MVAEGFEWAILQEHAARNSGFLLRVDDFTDPHQTNPAYKNYFYKVAEKQVKTLGTAAIRTTLARIVGQTPYPQITNLFISQSAYRQNYRSYEEYIAGMAISKFPSLFTPEELTVVSNSVKAKVADPQFMAATLADDCTANKYLAAAFNLILETQNRTSNGYVTYTNSIQASSPDEYAARNDNMSFIISGTTSPRSLTDLRANVYLDLYVKIFNLGPEDLNNVHVRMEVDGTVNQQLTIPQMTRDQVALATGKSLSSQQFFLRQALVTLNRMRAVDLVVSAAGTPSQGVYPGGSQAPYKTDWEPNPCDNWLRFNYYLLDLTNPCPPPRVTLINSPTNVGCTPEQNCAGSH